MGTKTLAQLRRLKYVPASVEAKVRIINAKIFAAAFYGIEAAEVAPAKIAKLAAAIIDTFRDRNNSHNANKFFTVMSKDKDDMDPVVQILTRRVLQTRRACVKKKGLKERFEKIIDIYANKNKKGTSWPQWYHHVQSEEDARPTAYPAGQPHPTTKEHEKDWNEEIDPQGPICLLIEALTWNGMKLDKRLRIWQAQEEPIDIMQVPYQSLKDLVSKAAARARSNAEWSRDTTERTMAREIDREASQISKALNEEEKGIVRTFAIGSNMSKFKKAEINEDIDGKCDYCGEEAATMSHTPWECRFFDGIKEKADKLLHGIPIKYIHQCIRCGIAPAMKLEGKATYWGMELGEDINAKAKRLLGYDDELHRPGENSVETQDREEALKVSEQHERRGKNARQTFLMHKKGHGTGIDMEFPKESEIKDNMQGHHEQFYAPMFGDGSQTTPQNYWAALGGSGLWVPDWNAAGENEEQRREQNLAIPAIGQMGSSTRQELAGWLLALSLPIRSMYATDSASMLGKAEALILAATRMKKGQVEGKKVDWSRPFKKPWGLQKDGDLWKQAWKAILRRGVDNQRLRKVKGHATAEDIEKGRSTTEDKIGNDKSDANADAGVEAIAGRGLVKLGSWAAARHQRYVKFVGRVQKYIATIVLAEKEERSKRKQVEKVEKRI